MSLRSALTESLRAPFTGVDSTAVTACSSMLTSFNGATTTATAGGTTGKTDFSGTAVIGGLNGVW
eukprot:CAMPEP_0185009870 /NCGR_PEP_ID=MMETSP1098-20130426/93370_1 /TAXON_ID=89044 /ORGANISM="Spumella elongata, Strain CCAP 955/1" /LENGTH=64 /DNA_ID=CAMNT_0027538629 /DNA_START=308 /DNA_END=499 /DNA_ORIENTATION=+